MDNSNKMLLFVALFAFIMGSAHTAHNVTCKNCWYSTVADILFDDTNCNTESGLKLVEKEVCEGSCFSINYDGLGQKYVKRGCEAVCEPGMVDVAKVVGQGNKTCCSTDNCNNVVFAGGAMPHPFVLLTTLSATAILLYNTAI